MNPLDPREIATEIIKRNAKDIDVQSVAMLADDIAQALQDERDAWSMRVQVARPEPGDVIVLVHPEHLSQRAVEYVQEGFQRAFPHLRCVVLDGGLTIDRIIRQASEGNNEPG